MLNKIRSFAGKVPGILIGFLIIFIYFSISTKGFFSQYNIMNLLKNSVILVIASFGMAIAILSAKIDLSIGSVMSLSGVITAICLHSGLNMIVSILFGMIVGAVFGFINGYLIAIQKFDFWVVTFATMGISQGFALAITKGNVIPGFSDAFRFIGDGKIFGIYFMILFAALLSVVIILLLNKSKFGYDVYAVGGSESCARLSGINVESVRIKVYILSGVIASISGILLCSKTNSASPIGGSGYEFDAIAAVLIGGIPFDGGKGTVTGTILGAILITMLKNGLNLMGFTSPVQFTLIGVIILSIIVIDVLNEKRKKSQALRRKY